MPEDEDEPPPVVRAEQSTVVTEQTTLVPNEAEAFALGPLEMTTVGEFKMFLARHAPLFVGRILNLLTKCCETQKKTGQTFAFTGTERKAKRKRKLIVDEQKSIEGETMKLQLQVEENF